MSQKIVFTIEQGDITDFESDVIALKYAQQLYGADQVVAFALRNAGVAIDRNFPKIGDYLYVETQGCIRAHHALFVGVPPLREFGYQKIREFTLQVLKILSQEAPTTKHLVMTIHGPGYGLDENEAALAQIAGYFQAIRMGEVPIDIERISIIDKNVERVQRLRRAIDQNPLVASYATQLKSEWGYCLIVPQRLGHAISPIEMAGKESEAKPHVFVAMPFRKDMDDVFYYGIQGPIHAAGFLCERVDQDAFTGDILDRVKKRIETASLVIAELSGSNPNVYLEVGYAWGKGRPTILLVKDAKELRFDVQGQRCLAYERIKDLEELLTMELKGFKSKKIL